MSCTLKVIKRQNTGIFCPTLSTSFELNGYLNNKLKASTTLNDLAESAVLDVQIQLQSLAITEANTPPLSQEEQLLTKLGFTKHQYEQEP